MLKQFFKDTPNSVFFWNGLVLLLFTILCSMGESVALGTMLVISIPALFRIIINLEDAKYDDSIKVIGYHYWVYLTPLTWILFIIAAIIALVFWLANKGANKVKQFNNWLNKK
ncbi:amino acid transporter [Flavobacterium phage vB_FspM_immuto_3-5A]|nr:amino acid transporter [Flavobacterium phage vB_FspM_immuto_3-5A]QQO92200.1 amino acid transporter [Flavobacterium phage vB_FspM_immuto_13-6C]